VEQSVPDMSKNYIYNNHSHSHESEVYSAKHCRHCTNK